MAVASPERLRDDLVRLAHRGADVRGFVHDAARVLSRAVPFDGVCVLTMDPDTLLPTGEVVENGLPVTAFARMSEIEHAGEDFNAFVALARSGPRAATLSAATGGDLDRSLRHREVRRPNGLGDELRAALVGETATWGALTLLRGEDVAHFEPADAAVVASLGGPLADGLRRAMLLTAPPGDGHVEPGDGSAGVVLLADDNAVVSADPVAEAWLAELRATACAGASLPPVVTAVAGRARAVAASSEATGPAAQARVRAASGVWLLVRGSVLGEGEGACTAVIIEPARQRELAPLVADAYGLTERERAVTQLVARGLRTEAIGARLFISPWTVQDHLKSVFEKVGVSSRGELVARVFFESHAPSLTDATRPAL